MIQPPIRQALPLERTLHLLVPLDPARRPTPTHLIDEPYPLLQAHLLRPQRLANPLSIAPAAQRRHALPSDWLCASVLAASTPE